MSQGIFPNIVPSTTSGNQLATLLNDFKDAVVSGFTGTSRPSLLQAGGYWIDTTTTTWQLKVYDGTQDIIAMYLNTTTGLASIPSASDEFEIYHESNDTVGPILKFTKARVTGLGQVLDGDIIGEHNYYGTSDTGAELIQARIKVYSSDNVTSSAKGSYLTFELNLDGTATMAEWMRLYERNLGVGVTAPTERIHSAGNVRAENTADSTSPAKFIARKKRVTGLGQVLDGDELGSIEIKSVDDAGTEFTAATIHVEATEDQTSSARGNKVVIKSTDIGASSPSEKVRINEDINLYEDLITDGFFHYFGPKNTDGTWRHGIVGGNYVIQLRESGSYVTKQELSA